MVTRIARCFAESRCLAQRIFAVLGVLLMCSAHAAVPVPNAQIVPNSVGTGPADRDVPFLATYKDLSVNGYVEQEVLFSGTANVYDYADKNGANVSPVPQATGATGSYVTRMLVRRPQNPVNFNGVVYLEILNATANYDGSPMWDLTHRQMLTDGAVYVGVTYSDTTARFMRDIWGTTAFPSPAGAQPRNRSRYATLDIKTRAHTWDILDQAAALLRADTNANNPLNGFAVDTIIATGYSQSAGYVVTYANSFYPSYSELEPCTDELAATGDCKPLVNGYIVAAGGPTARLLNGAGSNPVGNQRNCENALNRETPCIESAIEPFAADPYEYDLPKIVRFTTESDLKSVRVRQTMLDQPNLRTYEVAGVAHVGFWLSLEGQRVAEYQFGIPATGVVDSPCILPFNPLRTGPVLSAVQYRLARWIQYNETPPPSYFMEWEGDFTQEDQFFVPLANWVRDDGDNDASDGDDGEGDGNAIGGVRPARLTTPLGRYYGSNFFDGPFSVNRIFCTGIYGGFEAYTPEDVQARYYNKDTFVALTWWSIWRAYTEGFLLAPDANVILDEARAYDGLPD
jgi:hypothetical protein